MSSTPFIQQRPIQINQHDSTETTKLKQQVRDLLIELFSPYNHQHDGLEQTSWQFICTTLILPLICFVPIYVLSWLNPCLSYDEVLLLKDLSLGLFTLSYVTATVHVIIFNFTMKFCSPTAKYHHYLHMTVLFGAMGATISWLNFFTYSPWFGWYLPACLSSFIVFIEYFTSVAQMHNYRFCTMGGHDMDEVDTVIASNCCGEWTLGDLFILFSCIFAISWIAFNMVTIALSSPLLYEGVREQVLALGCLALPTYSPTMSPTN